MNSPLFSIVTPVYNPPIGVLTAMIKSVLAQSIDDWEFILVDDCSPNAEVREVLRKFAAKDSRIKVIERETNGHIVAASNDGVAAARGEFIALLDHDDLLAPGALEANAKVIAEHDDVDYLYSDEDHVDDAGNFFGTFRKPPWSPERMRGQMYTCHLSVLRTSLVREVEGFHQGFDGAQDWDLVLRVTERARRIVHIPEVLYHWRMLEGSTALDSTAKPYAHFAAMRAIQAHLDRVEINATVGETSWPGQYSILRRPSERRKVSVIIPTIGASKLVFGTHRPVVVNAVQSVLAEAVDYDLEVVVVYDPPTPAKVLAELRELAGDRLVLVAFDEPFNFSRKINVGALHATGGILLLLNDDVEAVAPGWLAQLVEPLEDPTVGLTGARLLFEDGRVQHVGHRYAEDYYHVRIGSAGNDPGPFGASQLNREVSGVTGACMAVRALDFEEVGGFCEALPNNYNDVDFCMKIRKARLQILYVAKAELFHFESVSRDPEVRPWEFAFVRERWGVPGHDLYTPDD